MGVPVFEMLRFLSVRHLAVIDRVEVDFEPGLNVLTGETGAGKSILVEAIDLLVGGRASADLVRTGEDHATIQAIFDLPAAAPGLSGREVIVRREISSQGRSRGFIDDALATAGALKELGASVLSLHGQHEHQSLVDPQEHVDLLDAFAGHADLVGTLSSTYDHWRNAAEALQRTQLTDREKRARSEIAAFQLQEIDAVAPRAGEDDALAAERQVLANADRLSRLSSEAYAALYEGEGAALSTLASVWKRVSDLAALDPRAATHLEARDDIHNRLEDLAIFLRDYRNRLDASPDRLQAVEDRLAALERLKRRYGPGLEDVMTRRLALQAELDELGAGDERAAQLAEAERRMRSQYRDIAAAVHASRLTAARTLGAALARDLSELAMPACRVDVRVAAVEDSARWTRRGTDDVEFFFSPNLGEDLRPLARIASGGELSRFMLALRLLTRREAAGQTLIFDEVDAGIGGAAADAVGARLQALGRHQQVLCVTHLAPIAARADAHFEIVKQVKGGRTHTSVRKLDAAQREQEVARMIAGAAVSPAVLASAREMLAARSSSEEKTKDAGTPERRSRGGRRGA
ncbi:MAG TPA: DNA repair protein RecN [Vicinamibacterales bacterium]|nr:DNA repair protein RecN [Vicinamibacterales bacterium]